MENSWQFMDLQSFIAHQHDFPLELVVFKPVVPSHKRPGAVKPRYAEGHSLAVAAAHGGGQESGGPCGAWADDFLI